MATSIQWQYQISPMNNWRHASAGWKAADGSGGEQPPPLGRTI